MTSKGDVLVNVVDYADYKFGNGYKPFLRGVDSVPVSGAVIDSSDILSVVSAALDGWFTENKYCQNFSDWLKEYLGTRHVTLCNSGSSANLLALSAVAETYGHKGKKVVTSATGFPTTVSSIIQAGYIPLFIDADPTTLNCDWSQMDEALHREDVVGIIQAHTLGFPYDSEYVRAICDEEGKFFIEDVCDALGAKIDGHMAGTFGDAATLSFFPAHQVCTGEGGAVYTNLGRLHRVIQSLSNWGRDCWCKPGESGTCGKRFDQDFHTLPAGWDHKYTFSRLGYNLKMTELQAALGVSQLGRINEFVQKRRQNFDILLEELTQYQDDLSFVNVIANVEPSPFGFPITVKPDAPFTRKELVNYLEDHKIHTRPVFGGNLSRHPAFLNAPHEKFTEILSGADYVMENTFWIGVWPGLWTTHLEYIVEIFGDFFDEW